MSEVVANYYNILKRVISTEKTSMMEANSEYAFYVSAAANKIEIKKAIELCFGVNVVRVRTLVAKGKKKMHARRVGYRSDRKKAFVRLAQGQVIDFESL